MTIFGAALAAAAPSCAATLEVGTGRTFATIGSAAAAARDGDIISIFPGTYTTGAVFRANNLTIRKALGVTGTVKVRDGEVDGKGLFVIKGDNATVSDIRFENARVPDGNGAGIRFEGNGLTVRNAGFFSNENGVLVTPGTGKTGGAISISGANFNGQGTRGTSSPAHGIYVTAAASLSVTGSTFVRAHDGHHIKTRANNTTISDNTIDDTNGRASYLIDVSEGGAATITRNMLVKGSYSDNRTAVSYGSMMHYGADAQQPAGPVVIADNTFINRKASSTYFVRNDSIPANPVALTGNILQAAAGSIAPLYGVGTVNGVAQDAVELLAGAIDGADRWLEDGDWDSIGTRFGFAPEEDTFAAAGFTLSEVRAAVPAPSVVGLTGLLLVGLALARHARRRAA